MRFSPFISRLVYTFSNLTRVRAPQSLGAQTPLAATHPLRASMPSIPFLGALFGSSASQQDKMSYPDKKSDDEWRAILNKGNRAPGSGKFDKHYPEEGVYACAGCSAPLYKATHKFKSGCGWPAYFDSLPGAVVRHEDRAFGMARTEIVCANCGGHLGHVFKGEGFDTPTDERHCVNSVSLTFSPDEKKAGEGSGDGAKGESKV
ncbi:methionine-R-sulfoxide reductase [Colletotrichum tofieldiae]|nr:methionine-R-sulfoxide reductase [Colletotrichum tofieldiae]